MQKGTDQSAAHVSPLVSTLRRVRCNRYVHPAEHRRPGPSPTARDPTWPSSSVAQSWFTHRKHLKRNRRPTRPLVNFAASRGAHSAKCSRRGKWDKYKYVLLSFSLFALYWPTRSPKQQLPRDSTDRVGGHRKTSLDTHATVNRSSIRRIHSTTGRAVFGMVEHIWNWGCPARCQGNETAGPGHISQLAYT